MIDEKGVISDECVANFIISPSEGVPHPVTMTKSFPLANYYLFVYSLASQYDRAGIPEKAESYYEKASSLNPGYRSGLIEYSRFLLKIRKHQKCLNLIENVREDENLQFEYFLVKGQALMGLEKYFMAIENFQQGNQIYDSDFRLLNSLGYCFYKTGDKQRAREVLRSSLKLNPEQEDVKALLQEIEKENDKP
jgi:tetratricopeptide (TPR) repeat protein